MIIEIKITEISVDKGDPLVLSRQITHALYNKVMEYFQSEGPGWLPLKERTKRQRIAQGFGEGPILDRKRGRLGLRMGIIEAPSADKALVGVRAGIEYAKIHQFGGVIDRVSKPGSVRLRTTKSGSLKRQKNYNNLAVFSKKRHKQSREVKYPGGKAFKINIPARPYLKSSPELLEDIAAIAKKFFEESK